jgi:endonuclease/exonuclease/phosphatase family metal-dependent hydrolase
MRRRWLVLGTTVLAAVWMLSWRGTAAAEDRRTDASRLVVMTLNAEFLWDGKEPEEGQVAFPWKGSEPEAQEHMAEIAALIRRVDADVVNLVEVENLDALNALNTLYLGRCGYRAYLVNGRDTFTGQDVGLLTRIDPEGEELRRWDTEGVSGGVAWSVSRNYYAKLEVSGKRLVLVGLHFLSQPLAEDRRLPREAQADAIRRLGEELLKEGYLLVVLGDFNDYDGSAESLDHIGSTPVTNVLATVRGMAQDTLSDDLVNVAAFVPPEQRYTSFWDKNGNHRVDSPGELTSTDHILISPALAAAVEAVSIPHDHDPVSVTDHFPVAVELRLVGEPSPAHGATVRIERLLPDPPGRDEISEEAVIRNTGNEPVDMTNWRLRDAVGKEWSLNALGILEPGERKRIKRDGQPMAMNNTGDTIQLVDPTGAVVDSVTYGPVQRGEYVGPAA